MTGALGQAPFGWQPDRTRFIVTNRAGAATLAGGVYRLDLNTDDGDVADNSIGAVDSGFANIVDPDTTDADWQGIVVIAESAVADNATLMVTLSGVVQALVDGTTDVADGDPLQVETGQTNALVLATVTVDRAYAIALEVRTANTVGLMNVLFNGAQGFQSGPQN